MRLPVYGYTAKILHHEMTTPKMVAEILIVGGGIAGLAAAIALRQRGLEPLVLERALELREIGAGLLLAPNACAVLDRLGALPFLLAGRSLPVAQWELCDDRGAVLSKVTVPRVGEHNLSTRRSDLQWALMQCLPTDTVQLGCVATGAQLTDTGVSVTLEDGRILHARYLIVADGAHSAIRTALWPGREPGYQGYVGWRGMVDFVPGGWEGGRVTESWGRGKRFGISPVGGGRTYWYATTSIPEALCRERVRMAQLRRHFSGWHHPVGEILEAATDSDLLQHPIMDRRPPLHWQREEKAVLLGDAAHSLTPNLGQGAAMALEDAWQIAVHWGKPNAMVRFERERRFRLMRLWAVSRWLGVMIQWENPILCALRDLQMRLTPDTFSTMSMRNLLHFQPGELHQ